MEVKNIECRTCRRELEEGVNVLEVQEGIIGKLGFVALGEKLLFCKLRLPSRLPGRLERACVEEADSVRALGPDSSRRQAANQARRA